MLNGSRCRVFVYRSPSKHLAEDLKFFHCRSTSSEFDDRPVVVHQSNQHSEATWTQIGVQYLRVSGVVSFYSNRSEAASGYKDAGFCLQTQDPVQNEDLMCSIECFGY